MKFKTGTVREMYDYFREKKFDVSTEFVYTPIRGIVFTISRGDCYTTSKPINVFAADVSEIITFCEKLIREFEQTHADIKRYFYMGKPYYINEKGEEKKMTHYEKYHEAAKKDNDVQRVLNMLCSLNYDGRHKPVAIEKVVFNDPATIILWTDGSKTVVKCENETYDPEKEKKV